MTIVEFLRERLDEDEWWAREASRDGDRYTPAGEHWQWECSEDDTVIQPDPVVGEFMECEHEHLGMALRSAEQYPTNMPYELPHFVLRGVEELQPAVAGFIQRHDPARVLADVEAKRRIVDACEMEERHLEQSYGQYAHHLAPPDVLALLALPYSDHPDYDPTWRPA